MATKTIQQLKQKFKFSIRCRCYGQITSWELGIFEALDKETAGFTALQKLQETGRAMRVSIVSIRKVKN